MSSFYNSLTKLHPTKNFAQFSVKMLDYFNDPCYTFQKVIDYANDY